MKPGNPSRDNPPRKKAVQSVKLPCRDKVWVNPKSYVKNLCEQAWKPAGAPSPKFVDMSQIDMRRKKPPESVKTKAAAAPGTQIPHTMYAAVAAKISAGRSLLHRRDGAFYGTMVPCLN